MAGIDIKINAVTEMDPNSPFLKQLTDAINSAMSNVNLASLVLKGDATSFNAVRKRRAYDRAYNSVYDEGEDNGDEADAAGKKAADDASIPDSTLQMLGYMKDLGDTMKSFSESIVGFIQMGFGIVEDIYKQMKKSSPLLDTIENLFNMAMQLFFMPLGNKLAEVMLPAIINMMDAVVDIWDKFDNKSLGEMFSIAIVEGVNLIASYMMDLGGLLKDQGDIVGSIGSMITSIGNFLSKYGDDIVRVVEKVMGFLMENIGTFIVLAGEFFITSLAIQAGILAYLMAQLDWKGALSKIAAGAAFTAVAAGGAYLIADTVGDSIMGYADGGYIPATPGGQIIRVAEGGEGEYVVPESKIGMIPYNPTLAGNVSNSSISNVGGSSNITNYFNFNGLTNDELKHIIRDEVNDMVSQSKYRGGF
jgi:hypothetical protein